MELSTKSVLITGAGGFIGSNIVKEFLNGDFIIYALCHNFVPDEFKDNKKIKIFKCDVTNDLEVNKIKEILKKDNLKTFNYIIHVAGLASDVGKDSKFRKLNYESVKNITLLPFETLIYISSTDVYGIKDFNGENEDELPFLEFPKNPYPKYKIKSEMWLKKNISANKYITIRPAAVWGENDKTLEERFVNFLKHSPFIIHFGKWKGQNRWPLANIKTLAKVIYNLCTNTSLREKFLGQAINIIDSKKTTIDEYYRELGLKYFPNKKFKTITLPIFCGKFLGIISSFLSNIIGTKHPIFDPSYYALHHVSSNLDFGNDKMIEILGEKKL